MKEGIQSDDKNHQQSPVFVGGDVYMPAWDRNGNEIPDPEEDVQEYSALPPIVDVEIPDPDEEVAEKSWEGKELGLPPPMTPEFGALIPPSLPTEEAPPDPLDIAYEGVSELQKRTIENPELLSDKEASKRFLSEERQKLAEEIRAERRKSRDKLALLSARTEIEGMFPTKEQADIERMAVNYGALSDMRAGEANGIAERLTGADSELSQEDASEERENIKQLVENDDKLKVLRSKLAEHYAKADGLAKGKFEKIQKSVEQALVRNKAFLVHTLTTHEKLRHNANSNITNRATFEDDIDLLLSLEPSISTSSITPGIKTSLFQEEFSNMGVILGGGDIEGASSCDADSKSTGIKRRRIIGDRGVSVDKIDETIGQRTGSGYNEIVVNNPKVFGVFKSVEIDESGKMIGSPKAFEQYIGTATQKGVPPYIMTPDRRLFEFVSIDDNGTVTVGNEITPEQVATGNAGLPSDKRKEIGDEILQKHLFRDVHAQKEAKAIVASLSGEVIAEIQLSNEEYLTQLRNNPTEIDSQLVYFPETLRGDKQFMLESAHVDAVSTYRNATEELMNDIDFVKQVYALRSSQQQRPLYSSLPLELRKDQEIALLAIDNGELDLLDSSLAESPEVWDRLVNKEIDNNDPKKWFSRAVGEVQVRNISLYMRTENSTVDYTERLLSNPGFIDKFAQRYPNFKFEIDEYNQLLVTKLS